MDFVLHINSLCETEYSLEEPEIGLIERTR